MVERIASMMTLQPNNQSDYQQRHAELWPEMKATLKAHGASNYSIFLNPVTDQLFAYLEVENRQDYEKISEAAICRKWWEYMEPLMICKADSSPVTLDLQEVFYLE